MGDLSLGSEPGCAQCGERQCQDPEYLCAVTYLYLCQLSLHQASFYHARGDKVLCRAWLQMRKVSSYHVSDIPQQARHLIKNLLEL